MSGVEGDQDSHADMEFEKNAGEEVGKAAL